MMRMDDFNNVVGLDSFENGEADEFDFDVGDLLEQPFADLIQDFKLETEILQEVGVLICRLSFLLYFTFSKSGGR